MASDNAVKVPSRWYYAVGAAFAIAGIAVFVVLLITRLPSMLPSIQVVVPGTQEIDLPKEGKYTIFMKNGASLATEFMLPIRLCLACQ